MKLHSTVLHIVLISLLFIFNTSCSENPGEMELILVDGKNFVTSTGEIIVFHGLNVSDPDKLANDGKWTRAHFEEAKNWGANIIRLPIHPARWRDRGQEEYLQLLDQAVSWANELELYLIFDWHSIGNLKEEKFQHEMYITDLEETHEFWDIVSERYADEPVVAMYELYNEPTVTGERFGELSWEEWKVMNEEMIDIVRKNDPEAVILVAGFNWAYDLTPVKNNPVDREGIAYVSHPYPEKRDQPWEPKWEKDWGFVADNYPVILTEIGYALPEEPGVHVPVHGDETYGNALVDYSGSNGISWVVWCFDPDWSPVMFFDWDYTPSSQGQFFREVMLED